MTATGGGERIDEPSKEVIYKKEASHYRGKFAFVYAEALGA